MIQSCFEEEKKTKSKVKTYMYIKEVINPFPC